jgi:hypothetical protein
VGGGRAVLRWGQGLGHQGGSEGDRVLGVGVERHGAAEGHADLAGYQGGAGGAAHEEHGVGLVGTQAGGGDRSGQGLGRRGQEGGDQALHLLPRQEHLVPQGR